MTGIETGAFGAIALLILALAALAVVLYLIPVRLWIAAFASGAYVGLFTLVAMGISLNIYSIFGLFLLMGVVKKNSILQVDYTNVLRERGVPRLAAQLEADRARLRPILMTTLAIVFGMLPIAFGKGDGSASRAALAITVVGGQSLCLLITLLITPVVYSLFDDLRGGRALAWVRRPAGRAREAVARGLQQVQGRLANGRRPDRP